MISSREEEGERERERVREREGRGERMKRVFAWTKLSANEKQEKDLPQKEKGRKKRRSRKGGLVEGVAEG